MGYGCRTSAASALADDARISHHHPMIEGFGQFGQVATRGRRSARTCSGRTRTGRWPVDLWNPYGGISHTNVDSTTDPFWYIRLAQTFSFAPLPYTPMGY
jgi:hypothetical protein